MNTGDDVTIDNALTADTDAQVLGPFNASDAGTVQRRVRYTVVVLPAYVPLFLTAPLSPRQAWELVRAQIVAYGRGAACEPLIDYLRLAMEPDCVLTTSYNPVTDARLIGIESEPNGLQVASELLVKKHGRLQHTINCTQHH